ncbi:MAG: DUF3455 domain-containing protein [Burkholderia gladioli]
MADQGAVQGAMRRAGRVRAASLAMAGAALAALGACAVPQAGSPAAAAPTGASLEPPGGGVPALTLTASGVQVYACEFDAQHRLGWVFKRPAATLYDAAGQARVQHGAGPSWAAADGSRIVGRVLAQQPSATPGSIPQLLLETHDTGGAGLLAGVRHVQRLATVGGATPAAPCTGEHQEGSTPYLARYAFYR